MSGNSVPPHVEGLSRGIDRLILTSDNSIFPHVEGLLRGTHQLILTRDFASTLLVSSSEEESRQAIAEFSRTLPGPVSLEQRRHVLRHFDLILRPQTDLITLLQLRAILNDSLIVHESRWRPRYSSVHPAQAVAASERPASVISRVREFADTLRPSMSRARIEEMIDFFAASIHLKRKFYDILVEQFRLSIVGRFRRRLVDSMLELMFLSLPGDVEKGLFRAFHISRLGRLEAFMKTLGSITSTALKKEMIREFIQTMLAPAGEREVMELADVIIPHHEAKHISSETCRYLLNQIRSRLRPSRASVMERNEGSEVDDEEEDHDVQQHPSLWVPAWFELSKTHHPIPASDLVYASDADRAGRPNEARNYLRELSWLQTKLRSIGMMYYDMAGIVGKPFLTQDPIHRLYKRFIPMTAAKLRDAKTPIKFSFESLPEIVDWLALDEDECAKLESNIAQVQNTGSNSTLEIKGHSEAMHPGTCEPDCEPGSRRSSNQRLWRR